ncbi:MAG: hypothetical protein A3K83_07445 [Omnitrophica WOR_2 bacterium RBG_13_44_8b]|nr:MAG: hypothetical protein A3K83_07445 [Omnitrophica WOR_2 bacterium RBG_13_44_8b]
MRNFSLRSIIIDIIIIIFIGALNPVVYAQQLGLDSTDNRGFVESNPAPEAKKGTVVFKEPTAGEPFWKQEKNLTELQKQARIYRAQGLEFQHIGNLDEATVFYQKAIQLDPAYAVAFNDLGIVYETRGFIDRAEECYLQAVKVNPNYLSAYTNLALFYESKRDLGKAAFCWKKRFELGSPDDPWTQKAKQRVVDINLVSSTNPRQDQREQEIMALLEKTAVQQSILRKEDKALANKHFEKAKQSYVKQDYATAIKEAFNALQLDPANQEIDKFIEKVQNRALSK